LDFLHFKKKFFPDYFLIEEVNEYDINGHSKDEEILR